MRARIHKISTLINNKIKCSIRKISELTGISKSSVHRLKKALFDRNQYPESYFWETKEGYHWLCILVYATIFLFGIKCGIGAETISHFFKMLRLSKHIGVSPTTIKDLRNRMQDILIDYKNDQEKHHPREELLKVAGGADETFFEKMILVFMDLSSGYIFF